MSLALLLGVRQLSSSAREVFCLFAETECARRFEVEAVWERGFGRLALLAALIILDDDF